MQLGRLGSLVGFSVGCVGAGVQMIVPDPKFYGWSLIAIGGATMAVSLVWWFFANYRIRWPWTARAVASAKDDIVPQNSPTRVCEFGQYTWKIEHIDRGENYGGNQPYYRLTMPIKFVANAKAVTIRVTAMREITWYLDRRSSPQYSWKVVETKDYYSGDVEEIIFATVAVNRQHHGCYGDMREDAFFVSGTSRHVFTFDIFYDGGKESTKLYLESPSKGVVANPNEGLGKLAGLIILQESDDVFNEDWATTGTPAPSAMQPPEDGPLWT